MGTEGWKDLWSFTFYAASALFYAIVVIVAIRGMGDVKRMIVSMVSEKSIRLTEGNALKQEEGEKP